MFASTAFCIATALLFVATAVLLFVYSVKRSIRDRKSKKATVGGHYKLGPSPSQYRRTQQSSQDDEESKTLKGAGEHEEDQRQQNYKDDEESLHGTGGRNNDIREGHFSDNVYQDPVISTPAAPYHPGNTYSGGHYPTNQSYSQYSHPQ
ncbi:hypothetical protein BGW38_000134 [Lunasporangiospora selenospora]|uniref:Uncharacterized protein n=1 Tax=Lunasporangiospora selenospora TaxID=979761 RepID=A0A9P6G2J2_9FUNG|nr:hypothetical protein BGW38_000134 [Lunasporangiospora selenospora]